MTVSILSLDLHISEVVLGLRGASAQQGEIQTLWE